MQWCRLIQADTAKRETVIGETETTPALMPSLLDGAELLSRHSRGWTDGRAHGGREATFSPMLGAKTDSLIGRSTLIR